MITAAKYILDYFWTSPEKLRQQQNDQFEAECNKFLETCEDFQRETNIEVVEEKVHDPSDCFKKTGIVTEVESNHVMIDNVLHFDLNTMKDYPNLIMGHKVVYLAYRHSDEVPIKIVKILNICNEVWDHDSNVTEQIKETISELKEEKPEYFSVHERSIPGVVKSKNGNLVIVDTGKKDIVFNLDTVEAKFKPKIGDEIICVCNVQSDLAFVDMSGEILEVTSFFWNRKKDIRGIITNVRSNGTGVIDDTYYFDLDVLDNFQPNKDDKVIAEVIESHQYSSNYEHEYDWRCLKVILSERARQEIQPSIVPTNNVKDHRWVSVSERLSATLSDLNESKDILVKIKNTGDIPLSIEQFRFIGPKSQSQLSLKHPNINSRIVLQPAEECDYCLVVHSKNFGQTIETFRMRFTRSERTISIIRKVEINVGNEMLEENCRDIPTDESYNNIKRSSAYTRSIWNRSKEIIPGQRPFLKNHFVHKRFGKYEVPIKLRDMVLGSDTENDISLLLDQCFPYLQETLDYHNYINTFQQLLYLEEIQQFHCMRRFDRDRAFFVREKEYLALEIKNVAERRPSLVLGDYVIATKLFSEDEASFEGIVHQVQQHKVLFKFTSAFHERYNGEDYRLEFHYSRASLRKQHHAVREVHKQLGCNFLFPSKTLSSDPQLNVHLNEKGELNDSYNRKLQWFNETLNPVQKEAICNILRGESRPMPYIIFGPPGTGKTMTVIELILQLHKNVSDTRLLIATPSNSAANLIAERLIDSGALIPGDFVRIVGQNLLEKELIPEKLLQYCVTCDIAEEYSTSDRQVKTESGLILNCNSRHLGRNKITIGTCITLGTLIQMKFPPNHFTHVIIDECGQCMESEVLVPLSLISDRGQVILAGDPMQLGPIVLSKFAENRGLGQSFLVRLLERFPYQKDFERFQNGYNPRLVTKLVYNYRSLPSILKVYSHLFYESKLKPMIDDEESYEAELLHNIKIDNTINLPQYGTLVKSHGVFFIGVRGENLQTIDSPSWYNAAEAKNLYLFVLKLLKLGITNDKIGIISPYTQQVKVVRKLFLEANVIPPKVGTVEEFQGQERQIIIISTVRSSQKYLCLDQQHSIGFVKSARRMNVAISRARALLIIFGNPHLLSQDENWAYLLKYCIDNGSYDGCDLPRTLFSVEDDDE